MKKRRIFSPAVYALTLKRLFWPFIVLTFLGGILLLFITFFWTEDGSNIWSNHFSLGMISNIYDHLLCYTPVTILFSFLAFPQIRKRKEADFFDSLPESRVSVFTGCTLGALTYSFLTFFLVFSLLFVILFSRLNPAPVFSLYLLKKVTELTLGVFLTLLAQTLFFTALAALARVLCGRTFKALTVSLLALPFWRGVFSLFLLLFSPFLYDIPNAILSFLSPTFCLPLPLLSSFEKSSLFGAAMDVPDTPSFHGTSQLSFSVRFIYYFIISLALLALGGVIYHKRGSEQVKKDVFPKVSSYIIPALLLALPCGILGAMAALPPLGAVLADYGSSILMNMAGYDLFFETKSLWLVLFAGIAFILFLLIGSKCKIKRLLRLLPTALPALFFGAALFLSFRAVYFYHQFEIPAEQIASASFDSPISSSSNVFYQDFLLLNTTKSDDPAVLSGVARGIKTDLNASYPLSPVTLTLKNGLKIRRLTHTYLILSAVHSDEETTVKPVDPNEFSSFILQMSNGMQLSVKKELVKKYFDCYNRYDVTEQKAAYNAYRPNDLSPTLLGKLPYEMAVSLDGGGVLDQTTTVYHTFRFDPPGEEAEKILFEILLETIQSAQHNPFNSSDKELRTLIQSAESFYKRYESNSCDDYRRFNISCALIRSEGLIYKSFEQGEEPEQLKRTLTFLQTIYPADDENAAAGSHTVMLAVFLNLEYTGALEPIRYHYVAPLRLTQEQYDALCS